MKLCKNLKGGLQEVADQLELRRVGPQHQAGSDSHLTGMAFFKIKEVCCTIRNAPDARSCSVLTKIHPTISLHKCLNFQIFFDGNIESTSGHLYGLGTPFASNINSFQDNGEGSNSS